jgi:hypothetical protein
LTPKIGGKKLGKKPIYINWSKNEASYLQSTTGEVSQMFYAQDKYIALKRGKNNSHFNEMLKH